MIPMVEFPHVAATTPCISRQLVGGNYHGSFRRITYQYTFTVLVSKSATSGKAVSTIVGLLQPDKVPAQIEAEYPGINIRGFGRIYEPADLDGYLACDIEAELTLDPLTEG